MEALAPLKGCGRTKGPQNWKPDLIGVTAIEKTQLFQPILSLHLVPEIKKRDA